MGVEKWEGQTSVFSTISSENTNQQYWALSIYGRKRSLEAVDAADGV
jgi:hypothetical protein